MDIRYVLIGMCMIFTFYGCIDDESKLGLKELSTIELVGDSLSEIYSVDKPEVFILGAPRVKQLNQEKPLQYEWQINYQVVGTQDTLRYLCRELGTFNCRLKIYNEDGAYFHKFQLNVRNAYEQGILVLSKYNGGTLLSFKRTDKDNFAPVRDVYAIDNPTLPLGTEPGAIFYSEYSSNMSDIYPIVYVMTENPRRNIRLDAKTLEVLDEVHVFEDAHIDNMYAMSFFHGKSIFAFGDEKVYDYDCESNFMRDVTYRCFSDGAKIANKTAFMYSMNYYQMGCPLWEKTKGELWMCLSSGFVYSMSGNLLNNMELISMMDCDNWNGLVLVLKDKKDGTISIASYVPNVDCMTTLWGTAPTPPLGVITLTKATRENNSHVTEHSVFLTRSGVPITYYSNGNKIYMYNYVGGNFADDAIISVGADGDQIVSMIFDADQTKLYVGVNTPGVEYMGSVYCYDIETYDLLWKESAMTGEIVSMLYKK